MTLPRQDSGSQPHPPLPLKLRPRLHAGAEAGHGQAGTLMRHPRRSPVDTAAAVPVLDLTIPVFNALRRVWMASPSPVLAYMDVDLSTDLAAPGPPPGAADLRTFGPRHRHPADP